MRAWSSSSRRLCRRPPARKPPAEHIALGDSLYAQFKPDEALTHYIAAIGADSSNYEALWKAARSEIDQAEVERDEARRDRLLEVRRGAMPVVRFA